MAEGEIENFRGERGHVIYSLETHSELHPAFHVDQLGLEPSIIPLTAFDIERARMLVSYNDRNIFQLD